MESRNDEISAMLARIALAGDGILFGVGVAYLSVRTWLKFHTHSSAVKKLEATPSTRIPDLRFLVPSSTKVAHPPETLVVVRGKVGTQASSMFEPSEYLESQGFNGKAVILERIQTCLYNEQRGLFGWGPGLSGLPGWGSLKERAVVSISKVPFVLKKGKAVVRINLDNSSHPLPLVTVYHKMNPVKATPYTFLQAVFGRGYPVGFLDEEKALLVGNEITAVGLLSFSPNGEPILMGSKKLPYFLSNLTREELIVDIGARANVFFWTGIVLSTCTIGILSYAFIKNWRKWKEWQQLRRRRVESARENRRLSEVEDEDVRNLSEAELCVVCLTRRRRAAFLPCGHLVCCMGCAQRVEEDINCRCPVCRNAVSGLVRIYDP